MIKRRGTKEIGLEVKWNFEFFGHGKVLSPRVDTVAIDIGNKLTAGIIDQHQDGQLAPCTAQLVFDRSELVYEHLMTSWLKRADDGIDLSKCCWRPIITTHKNPDFDGTVSALLIQELIENGAFPTWAQSLIGLTGLIDQGELMIAAQESDKLRTVALAFYALSPQVLERQLSDIERIKIGISLIRAEAHHLQQRIQNRPLTVDDWYGPESGGWQDTSEDATKVSAALRADYAQFQKEDEDGLFDKRKILVPVASSGGRSSIFVHATIAKQPSKTLMLKYWTRSAGSQMLICPIMSPSNLPDQYARVIISIDPNYREEGQKPSLEGLGRSLERLECQERVQRGAQRRTGTPRWAGVTNDDPWYDGRGHGHTIIDSPRSGTVLSYSQIVLTATGGRFWETQVEGRVLIHRICAGAFVPPSDPKERRRPNALTVNVKAIFNDLNMYTPPPNHPAFPDNKPFWKNMKGMENTALGKINLLTWPNIVPDFYIEETLWDYSGSDLNLDKWLTNLRRSEYSVFILMDFQIRAPKKNSHENDVPAILLSIPKKEINRTSLGNGLYCTGREILGFESSSNLSWEDLVGAQLTIAMYHGMLSHLLSEASETTGLPSPRDAHQLANKINDVLARYEVQELSGDPALQQLAQKMWTQLRIESLTRRLMHESNVLDSHVEKAQNRVIEIVLFGLGLFGLVEAITGMRDLVSNPDVYLIVLIILISLFVLLFVLLGLRKYKKRSKK